MNRLEELRGLLEAAQRVTLDEFGVASPEMRVALIGETNRAREALIVAAPALIKCADALKPFAEAMQRIEERGTVWIERPAQEGYVTLAQFKAAQSALAQLEADHG